MNRPVTHPGDGDARPARKAAASTGHAGALRVVAAGAEHLADLARLRVALLEETGAALTVPERQELVEANLAFFRARLGSPDWAHWVALAGTNVGAIGSLALWDRPPYPGNPQGKDAYLLNMYTAPAWRGTGAATAILRAALGEARRRGVGKVVLHATEAGRHLYDRAGFVASSAYMEIVLAVPPA